MSSGKRYSAVICCNSKNSILYLDPIAYYRPDSVHIFINNGIDSKAESESFERSYPLIDCKDRTVHECDTHDFERLLSEISSIIEELKMNYTESPDIFINITSGSHEFAAAAMMASVFNSDVVKAFRLDIGNVNGKCTVSEPKQVTSLTNDAPDKEMITFLEILSEKLSRHRTVCFREIIDDLKDMGQWSYDPKRKSNSGRDPLEHKEITYLARHYIKYAQECGWITRPSPHRIQITPAGRSLLNVHSGRIVMHECMTLSNACISDDVAPKQENEVFDILDECENTVSNLTINGRRYSFLSE